MKEGPSDEKPTHESSAGEGAEVSDGEPSAQVEGEPQEPIELPRAVTPEDLEPQVLKQGDTAVFVARHGDYDRNEESEHFGELTAEGYEQVKNRAFEIFHAMLSAIPKDERVNFYILLLASDANRGPGTGLRCVESARAWKEGALEALAEFGLTSNNLLNPWDPLKEQGDDYMPLASKIGMEHDLAGDPYAVNEQTAAFMEWLKVKCIEDGDHRPNAAWIAYETDTYKEKRIEMGADGPLEVAERLCNFLSAQHEFAKQFHAKYGNQYRLAIVNVAHTDNIHPLLKTAMSGHSTEDALQQVVNVEHGGGFSYGLHADGTTSKPVIDGRQYMVPHCNA